jgi:hypothetical protein
MKKKESTKKNAVPAKSIKASAAKKPSKKKVNSKKAITGTSTRKPTLSDILKIQAMKIDEQPDRHAPIVLSDTWYEYSVFLDKFHVSINTANNWLKYGWLPFSQLGRIRFINKTDIENMLLRFRRYTLVWLGWLMALPNDWTEWSF